MLDVTDIVVDLFAQRLGKASSAIVPGFRELVAVDP